MNSEPTDPLKQRARELGFQRVGVARAGRSPHADRYLASMAAGRFATMEYLSQNVERRVDPRNTLSGAATVVALTVPYADEVPQPESKGDGKIARYAWSRDYHKVIVPRLRDLAEYIRDGDRFRTWYNVDNGPILERDWAEAAGVGWIGKNGLVIDPATGSRFFLALVLTDRRYAADAAALDHCGTCTRCIDACPTGAIVSPRTIDSNRCISYLTIEHREEFDDEQAKSLHGWVFGCDICQDVCPFNTRAQRHAVPLDPALEPRNLPLDLVTLARMSREEFLVAFAGTPVNRTKDSGMRRNAKAVLEHESPNP